MNLKMIPEVNRIHYNQVSQEQRITNFNGCGSKGGWFNPPDFIFTASCFHHDFKYWRGKGPSIFSFEFWKHPIAYLIEKKLDRKMGDKAFKYYMIKDAESYPFHLKQKYLEIAYVYYWAVRIFGMFFYNWKGEKTKEDLK